MLWIGIIIGIVIGFMCKSIQTSIELQASFGVPLKPMREAASTKKAAAISELLTKRLKLSHQALKDGEAYQQWLSYSGSGVIDDITGPQDASGRFGSSWLANFITLADICGCRLELVDKFGPKTKENGA